MNVRCLFCFACAGFGERVCVVLNTQPHSRTWSNFKPMCAYDLHHALTLIILHNQSRCERADDVRSTYSALINWWGKITELITRLDDEQRAIPLGSLHALDKQSAPSKINMLLWEVPVIWGFREGVRDE